MPSVHSQAGLQRVVDRVRRRLFPIDVEEVRVGSTGDVEIQAIWTVEAPNEAVRTSLSPCHTLPEIECGNLCLSGLVDIAEAKQFRAFRPHIANLQHHLAAHLLLQVQVKVLHVRSADVWIGAEEIAERRRPCKERTI